MTARIDMTPGYAEHLMINVLILRLRLLREACRRLTLTPRYAEAVQRRFGSDRSDLSDSLLPKIQMALGPGWDATPLWVRGWTDYFAVVMSSWVKRIWPLAPLPSVPRVASWPTVKVTEVASPTHVNDVSPSFCAGVMVPVLGCTVV